MADQVVPFDTSKVNRGKPIWTESILMGITNELKKGGDEAIKVVYEPYTYEYKPGDKLYKLAPYDRLAPIEMQNKSQWFNWYNKYLKEAYDRVLGNLTPDNLGFEIKRVVALFLGTMNSGRRENMVRHHMVCETVHHINALQPGKEIEVIFDDWTYVERDKHGMKDSLQGHAKFKMERGESWGKVKMKECLVISFVPYIPVRQILADLMMETELDQYPGAVLCDTFNFSNNKLDPTSQRVVDWLQEYYESHDTDYTILPDDDTTHNEIFSTVEWTRLYIRKH